MSTKPTGIEAAMTHCRFILGDIHKHIVAHLAAQRDTSADPDVKAFWEGRRAYIDHAFTAAMSDSAEVEGFVADQAIKARGSSECAAQRAAWLGSPDSSRQTG